MTGGLGATLLSITVLGAFALIGGGIWMIAKQRDRQKGLLMIAAALVLAANVAIWVV
ncbi:hypothetical protein [Allosphingosinicella indica]|uniref:Uncharacterized protein n=1 Tax=Allosphingosinicella indica TaxID=941907 RepID=A0A1X7FXK9_9SPHN|nr:hypothetical protein [Allosphingosinicella indica]SMF60573.1 hypothetical protein SAMN06295910_0025 [Allosphingosinicella indica]